MNAWKTIRVFISSTFRDMQAERDWLVRFVFPRLREDLAKYRIHFVDVDLRWGVTSDQNALGVCRTVIDECHPRFMCMLGGRYGWVPEGQGKSITADEIHYGVLGREAEKRGHSFFYFRDVRATARMVEETPSDFREPNGSDNAQKLAALKKAIVDAGLNPRIYGEDAQWDAEQKRLAGLEAFGNQVHTDLFESLKSDPELAERFRGSTTPLDEFAEEAEQMEAFIEERTERFVLGSRKYLLDDMLAFVTGDPAVAGPNIFVLTGDPGSGKSAFLAKFTRDLAALHSSYFLLPTFVGASTGSTDLRRTLRRLCHDLALAADNTEPLPLDIKELITHFQKLLAEAAGRRRVILVFDALNQFDATDGAHWLNWLPRELPPGVRIVASVIAPADGQPEHQTLAILRTRPGTRLEKLEPLTEADTLAVIEGSLRRYAKRLSPEQLATLLAKPAGRLPLYVLTALEELRTLGTYEEITDRIRTLPGDARALFGWILTERLARDPGFRDREGWPCGAALVGKFAACLGVSRHGLSPAELAALLDPDDPLGNVAALLRLVRPYLMRRGELLDFYHGQFREAARAAHLDTPEKQRVAHQSVATCLQTFADPHRDGQCRDATPHALSELPHHQTRAEAWPDLIATLENIFFLEAKVTHGMTFDLAEDFTTAVDALPPEHIKRKRLRLLDEALRRDLHFIASHAKDYPQALFQCMWNSAWWYDCPDAAQHYARAKTASDNPTKREARGIAMVHELMEFWLKAKTTKTPGFLWLRSIRPPPEALGATPHIVLSGHVGPVGSVDYSPDGEKVVSGSQDGTVRIWDTTTGDTLLTLRGHEDVGAVAFSPDGRRVASADAEGRVILWDSHSGDRLWEVSFPEAAAHEKTRKERQNIDTENMSVAEADRMKAFAGAMGSVMQIHGGGYVSFSPDGRDLAVGFADEVVRILRCDSGEVAKTLGGAGIGRVWSVRYAPKGESLFTGSAGSLIAQWDVARGERVRVFDGVAGEILNLAISRDGSSLASGGGHLESAVFTWDASSGRQIHAHGIGSEVTRLYLMHFGKDGGLPEGSLIKNPETGSPFVRVMGLDYHTDGEHIAFGTWSLRGEDTSVTVFSATEHKVVHALSGHSNAVHSVKYSPDGRHLATGSADATIWIWDMENIGAPPPLHGHSRLIAAMGQPLYGTIIVTAAGSEVFVWDAETATILQSLEGPRPATKVLFSKDGHRFAVGALCLPVEGYNSVVVFESISGKTVGKLTWYGSQTTDWDFSNDGRHVLQGTEAGMLVVDNILDGGKVKRRTWKAFDTSVRECTFSTDGAWIIATSWDWEHQVVDVRTGERAGDHLARVIMFSSRMSIPKPPLLASTKNGCTALTSNASSQDIAYHPMIFDNGGHARRREPRFVFYRGRHLYVFDLEGSYLEMIDRAAGAESKNDYSAERREFRSGHSALSQAEEEPPEANLGVSGDHKKDPPPVKRRSWWKFWDGLL